MAALAAPPSDSSPSKRYILVVGDWVIDDYWMTGEHRSLTASRVGSLHLRALATPECCTALLAGAGRVANLLHVASATCLLPNTHIVGVGLWFRDDSEYLTKFFGSTPGVHGWSPFRLHRTPSSTIADLTLVNLADVLEIPRESHGTNRVVRVLQQRGRDLRLNGRVDWEARPSFLAHGHSGWINSENSPKLAEKWDDFVTINPAETGAVVIKDLGKGVVTDSLIQFLARKYPNSPWYVSTKHFSPQWLGYLNDLNVELYIIPEIAAKEAVRQGLVYSWFVASRSGRRPEPTRESLNAMTSLFDTYSQIKRVVALPKAYQVLGRHQNVGVCHSIAESEPYSQYASMASVFFPHATAMLLKDPGVDFGSLVDETLRYTQSANQAEAEWMREYTHKPLRYPPLSVTPSIAAAPPSPTTSSVTSPPARFAIERFDWTKWCDAWLESDLPPGVITIKAPTSFRNPTTDARFELWRGMSLVDEFVCWVPRRRKQVATLMERLRQFAAERNRTRNLAGVVRAAPGSGKTALVRSVANALNLQFLDFNITQLVSREEIVSCFDTLITTQAQDRRRPLLVFFDEIDAECGGSNVYDMFLAPLEDGVYSRDGKKYNIQPCVWLFATSGDLVGKKAPDFLSRLSLEEIDLTPKGDVGEHMEMVYRGVAMIQARFPDVRRVSRDVLEMLFHLPSKVLPRDFRKYLEACANVRYGEFSCRDFPPSDLADIWSIPGRPVAGAESKCQFVEIV